ncbi:MAG TPA: translocation/assembly module TamB domain-containing protein [Limnobacter sp.]|uniref:translocation/assembly module TamB domain-containing protein n=1 Tax=Limnobacter sp. TaxID=2003368 RepID=UPI002EDBB1F6
MRCRQQGFATALFGLLGTGIVLLALGMYWLLGTSAGLRWALGFIPQTQVGQVDGTVWQGFSLDALEWVSTRADGKTQRVAVSGLRLRVDWSALTTGTLRIEQLQAQAVSLNFPSNEEEKPIELPDKIELPLDVELQALRIDQLVVSPSVALEQVDARAVVRDGALTVEQWSTRLDGADLAVSGRLVLEKPYALTAQADAKRTVQDLALTAQARLAGSLDRTELSLTATGRQTPSEKAGKPRLTQTLQASGVLHPLTLAPVESATLDARQFNPRDWFSAAPKALLNIHLAVEPNADFSVINANLDVTNQTPLALQRGGLPLGRLVAKVHAQLKHGIPVQASATVQPIQLADERGPGGSVQLQAASDRLSNGLLTWSLRGQGIRPTVLADVPVADAFDVSVNGSVQAKRWTIDALDIQQKNARLQGDGYVNMAGNWPARVHVTFSHLNPAAWVPGASSWARGDLNGDGQFDGTLKSVRDEWMPAGRLRSQLQASRLADAPIQWHAMADGSLQRLTQVQVDLNMLGNTVRMDGAYGAPDDVLSLDAQLPQLAALGRVFNQPLAGDIRLKARLKGQGLQADAQGDLQVTGLRLADQAVVQGIQGSFALGSRPESPWTMDLQAEGIGQPLPGSPRLQLAETWVKTLRLQLTGTRRQHTFNAQVVSGLTPFSRQRPLKVDLSLRGGVGPQTDRPGQPLGWRGVLQSLKAEGLWTPARSLTLQKPVSLVWAPRYLQVGLLELMGEDKTLIRNTVLKLDGSTVQIEGEMPALGIPRLSPILRTQASIEPKDLVARVNWRYRANAASVQGVIDLQHVSGGLQVLEDSQIDVPIERFDAHLQFDRTAAAMQLDLVAPQFAAINANLRVPVQKNPVTQRWGLASNGPMQGSIAAGLYQLNWLGPLLSGGVRTNGTGQVAVAIAGSLNEPDVQGRLFFMDLDIFQLDQGVRLEDGNVVVDFNTSRARIEQAEFNVYNRRPPRKRIEQLGPLIQGTGRLTASGEWNLNGLKGVLTVKAQRAPLVQRFDRWVMLDAGLQVQQPDREGEPLRVRGDIEVLGAYVESPDSGVPTLSDDVVIQGRNAASAAGLPLDVQLQARLGKLFYVSAEGLNTRLEGGLKLSMLEGVGGSGNRRSGRRLSATGTIQAVDGTYRAYGQDLTIERGVVNFQGPLENPGINVRAVRKGVAVEAGVEITGTAQRPKVTLVSDPAVPDSEKLSWMIIGRGTNSADRDQTLLLTAAAAIFGNDDESPTRKIARQLGIDDVALSTGSLTAADSRAVGSKVAVAPGADLSANVIGADDPLLSQRIITIGKRISDKLYASFDQSVTTAASIFKLNYQYSRQLSLIARTGADNALDVLYQISFD